MEISRKKIDTTFANARIFNHPMGAGNKIEVGEPVFIEGGGFANSFNPFGGGFIRGVCLVSSDNTLGQAGDKRVDVETGTFVFNPDTNILFTPGWGNLGQLCYFLDQNTVTMNSAPPSIIAGTVHGIEPDGRVHVSLGAASANSVASGIGLPIREPVPTIIQSSLYNGTTTGSSGDTTPKTFWATSGHPVLFFYATTMTYDTAEAWAIDFTILVAGTPIATRMFRIRGTTANQPYFGCGQALVTLTPGSYQVNAAFTRVQGTGNASLSTSDFATISAIEF